MIYNYFTAHLRAVFGPPLGNIRKNIRRKERWMTK